MGNSISLTLAQSCYKFDRQTCIRTVGRLRGHSFNLSEAGEPQNGFGVASCRLRRPQPLPKSNKDHKSRFLRNSRSDFRAFLPVLLLRDIKEDRELAWVACARDIKNRARWKSRLSANIRDFQKIRCFRIVKKNCFSWRR